MRFGESLGTTANLATAVALVYFHDSAVLSKFLLVPTVGHGEPDAVTEVPRGLVGTKPQLALELKSREPLLGAAKKVNRQNPLDQRNTGAVHDRARRDGELLVTRPALPKPGPVRLAVQFGRLANNPAVRTGNALGPADTLYHLASLVLGHLRDLDDSHFVVLSHCVPRCHIYNVATKQRVVNKKMHYA